VEPGGGYVSGRLSARSRPQVGMTIRQMHKTTMGTESEIKRGEEENYSKPLSVGDSVEHVRLSCGWGSKGDRNGETQTLQKNIRVIVGFLDTSL